PFAADTSRGGELCGTHQNSRDRTFGKTALHQLSIEARPLERPRLGAQAAESKGSAAVSNLLPEKRTDTRIVVMEEHGGRFVPENTATLEETFTPVSVLAGCRREALVEGNR